MEKTSIPCPKKQQGAVTLLVTGVAAGDCDNYHYISG